jgi:hypothetical protein
MSPDEPQGLMGRLVSRAQQIGADPFRRGLMTAGASLLNSPGMGVPQALGQAVQRGFGAYDDQRDALAQRGFQQAQLDSVNQVREMQAMKLQADEQRKQQQAAARGQLLSEFRLTDGMPPAARRVAVTNLMIKAASMGLDDLVGPLSNIVNPIGDEPKVQARRQPEHYDLGDRIQLRDPDTGKVIETMFKHRMPGGDTGPDGLRGKPTEGMLRAAAIVPRMQVAHDALAAFDPQITARIAGGNLAGNFFATPEGRQYKAIGDSFLMGILRVESGAAISNEEMDSARATYLPQPGDDQETMRVKAQLRAQAISQVSNMAGYAKVPAAVVRLGKPAVGAKTKAAQEKYK